MARTGSSAWKIILIIAAVVLIVFAMVSGYAIWGVALLVLLLALAGGALLYRKGGAPSE